MTDQLKRRRSDSLSTVARFGTAIVGCILLAIGSRGLAVEVGVTHVLHTLLYLIPAVLGTLCLLIAIGAADVVLGYWQRFAKIVAGILPWRRDSKSEEKEDA